MNERIKKLAEQAGMTVDSDYSLYTKDFTTYGNFVEKFAQLIVLECEAYVAERFDSSEPWMRPGGLSRHFGVK